MILLEEERRREDVSLVEGCRNGDPDAFEELVRRYQDRVYNVAYRFLGNHEDAQDVAQEVFIRAYKGIRGFKGASKVYTWLYSIAGKLARNKIRDSKRKGRDRGASLEALEAEIGAIGDDDRRPDRAAREHEMEALLQECLDELPDHYRMTFVLRTFDDLSYDEIADVMGCPPGTVKSRLNQARGLLRERLLKLEIV